MSPNKNGAVQAEDVAQSETIDGTNIADIDDESLDEVAGGAGVYMMTCLNCGAKLRRGKRKCPKCGYAPAYL